MDELSVGVMPRRFETVEAMAAEVGQEIGRSGWITVDQQRIDRFAEATDDHQYIHVDPVRAAAETSFGGTIAHGYLTLSLLPRMFAETFQLVPKVTGINYGLDRVRFVAPVRSGARVRGRVVLQALERQGGDRIKVTCTVTVEIEGGDKPACVATAISLFVVA